MKKRICDSCKKVGWSYINELGHDWGEWSDATLKLQQDGSYAAYHSRTCTRCNEVEEELLDEQIPRLQLTASGDIPINVEEGSYWFTVNWQIDNTGTTELTNLSLVLVDPTGDQQISAVDDRHLSGTLASGDHATGLRGGAGDACASDSVIREAILPNLDQDGRYRCTAVAKGQDPVTGEWVEDTAEVVIDVHIRMPQEDAPIIRMSGTAYVGEPYDGEFDYNLLTPNQEYYDLVSWIPVEQEEAYGELGLSINSSNASGIYVVGTPTKTGTVTSEFAIAKEGLEDLTTVVIELQVIEKSDADAPNPKPLSLDAEGTVEAPATLEKWIGSVPGNGQGYFEEGETILYCFLVTNNATTEDEWPIMLRIEIYDELLDSESRIGYFEGLMAGE